VANRKQPATFALAVALALGCSSSGGGGKGSESDNPDAPLSALTEAERGDLCDFIAHRDGHVPPAFRPRANAAARPRFSVIVKPIVRGPGHRAETVRNQVNSLFENGELAAPFQ